MMTFVNVMKFYYLADTVRIAIRLYSERAHLGLSEYKKTKND